MHIDNGEGEHNMLQRENDRINCLFRFTIQPRAFLLSLEGQAEGCREAAGTHSLEALAFARGNLLRWRILPRVAMRQLFFQHAS